MVVKKASAGSSYHNRTGTTTVPAFQGVEVDPTGAGDCFAGGFVGYLANCGFDLADDNIDRKQLHRAVIYGSVMGSFCCEQVGVERFRTLTRKEIDQRFAEFRRFTTF